MFEGMGKKTALIYFLSFTSYLLTPPGQLGFGLECSCSFVSPALCSFSSHPLIYFSPAPLLPRHEILLSNTMQTVSLSLRPLLSCDALTTACHFTFIKDDI